MRGFHERRIEPVRGRIVGQRLRMPLDAVEEKLRNREFDCLDDAIVGVSYRAKRRRNYADCLMVHRVRRNPPHCDNACERAVAIDEHVVRSFVVLLPGFTRLMVPDPITLAQLALDIFDERTSEGDVRHLQAPANAKRRDSPRKSRANESELAFVALRILAFPALIGTTPVMLDGNVTSAAEQHAVEGFVLERMRRRLPAGQNDRLRT